MEISFKILRKGEYQVNQFRKSDRLNSTVFPNLDLTVNQIFQAGED